MHIENSFTRFMRTHRTWIMIVSLLLFLPPLAIVFQVTTGDGDFCGTWCPRMFYAIRKGAGIGEVIGGIMRAYMGVGLIAGVIISTFFLGRYWCSHLCPIGGAGELGSRFVPEKLKLHYESIPAAPVRYGYLGVYLAAPLLGLGSLCCNYCNFAAIPRLFGSLFIQADLAYFFRAYGIINLALFILLAVVAKGGRAYCNFLCPVGALDALSSRLGMRFGKRVTVVKHRCTGCGQCTDICPTWAISMHDASAKIDQLSCMPCHQCEKVCPEGAICYGKNV
ncbi:MAG: 4Fe-4S binding protein [Desulfuromonadaceae bacterium]|nr:4Fe-4S binding protein [Desulfuromonadaceae bacterium]